MDSLVFEESINAEITESEFISKKWVYVNDNNSQNYSSQVILDTTPLANAGGYVDWQEAYMIMPLVVQLSSTTATNLPVGAIDGDWSWAIKNGYWHMINSMTVEFNNQNICQQCPFLNVFRSFKAQTTFSKDDVENHGASIGFAMDTAGSWAYNTLPTVSTASGNLLSPSGLGLSNNRNWGDIRAVSVSTSITASSSVGAGSVGTPLFVSSPASGLVIPTAIPSTTNSYIKGFGANAPSQYGSVNLGMFQRQQFVNYDPDPKGAIAGGTSTGPTTPVTGQSFLNPQSATSAVYQSGKQVQTVAGAIAWNVFAKLRLKDLADFFTKCPLLKGSTMRFYLNTNQTDVTFTVVKPTVITASGLSVNSGALTINSVSTNGGLSCPLMIASADVGCGCFSLPADTYKLTVAIYKNTSAVLGGLPAAQSPLTAVRLYAPVYKFNPLAEQRYLSLAPQKKVEYNDIFQYQFASISAGQTFNFLVTNGISNIQSVLVVPLINSASNGVSTVLGSAGSAVVSGTTVLYPQGAAVNPLSTINSATSTTGATPDPIILSNFNILVSGVNLFLNNQMYDFEQFRHELMSSNQLNGNITSGLTSGLISEDMFSKGYRWYYGNCARALPSEDGVSRSVQIIGKNESAAPIDLMVFVEFKKSITIDISTGARIE